MKPGIYTILAGDYHADPAEQPSLSASIACILCEKSPRHAWVAHPRLNPDYVPRDESRFDIGRVAHALLLEGKTVLEACVVIDAPDWRKKGAQEERDAARAAGLTPLLIGQVAEVQAMLAATRAQLEVVDATPPLFVAGKSEQTLIWEEDGVTCRALVDWLHDDRSAIDDFKTTSASADPERWTRTLFQIGADVQAAFYRRGLHHLCFQQLIEPPLFRFVVQETYPPYALSVVSPGPAAVEVANAKVDYAIAKWRECLATDKWPAYTSRVAYADLPPWEDARWATKLMTEELAA